MIVSYDVLIVFYVGTSKRTVSKQYIVEEEVGEKEEVEEEKDAQTSLALVQIPTPAVILMGPKVHGDGSYRQSTHTTFLDSSEVTPVVTPL
jgi:hypothetical protein